jgi:hypothetical protein
MMDYGVVVLWRFEYMLILLLNILFKHKVMIRTKGDSYKQIANRSGFFLFFLGEGVVFLLLLRRLRL